MGNEYKPWVNNRRDINHYIPGWKHGRYHYFVSELECSYFLLLEWADQVIDVREQFPLLSIEDTISIAEEAGIIHPKHRDKESRKMYCYVLTTSFVYTVIKDGVKIDRARSLVYSRDLEQKRIIEKLEIERRYWANKGIDWGIVTEQDIPIQMVRNLDFLHGSYNWWVEGLTKDLEAAVITLLKNKAVQPYYKSLNRLAYITSDIDKELGLTPGTSLGLTWHLISRKKIQVDLNQELMGRLFEMRFV